MDSREYTQLKVGLHFKGIAQNGGEYFAKRLLPSFYSYEILRKFSYAKNLVILFSCTNKNEITKKEIKKKIGESSTY